LHRILSFSSEIHWRKRFVFRHYSQYKNVVSAAARQELFLRKFGFFNLLTVEEALSYLDFISLKGSKIWIFYAATQAD